MAILSLDAAEVVDDGDGMGVCGVSVEAGTEDGPLDESPTRNVLPPIGALRPTVSSNLVRLKLSRVAGAEIFCLEKFAG
jgi:hypothetical protein